MFVASDIPAILNHTRDMIFLEPGQVAEVSADSVIMTSVEGEAVEARVQHVAWDSSAAEKGEHKHFMLKEIYEQPQVAVNTLSGRVDFEKWEVRLSGIEQSVDDLRKYNRMIITACGTAAHAGMVGKILIEHLARIPVEVDIASEFRYRNPIIDDKTIVLPSASLVKLQILLLQWQRRNKRVL